MLKFFPVSSFTTYIIAIFSVGLGLGLRSVLELGLRSGFRVTVG